MIVSSRPPDNRFVMSTDWDGYLRFLDAVNGRRVKVTFDGESVELLTTSNRHELIKTRARMLLEATFLELDVDFLPGGSTTFKKKLKNKGFEPDECYRVGSWRQARDAEEDDKLPLPDLAIEVEVSVSVLDRLAIYAAFGVPEIWRVSKEGVISVWILKDGTYQANPTSLSLPGLPIDLMNTHMAEVGKLSGNRWIKRFLQALRDLP